MSKTKAAVHPLIERMESAKKAFQEEAKKVLGEETKAFFAANPEIATVVWKQYAPYFNDGDECVFSVREPAFLPNRDALSALAEDVVAKIRETEDEDMDVGGYSDVGGIIKQLTTLGWLKDAKRAPNAREAELVESCDAFSSLVQGLGDTMESIFGNHVLVTATASGFDVSEYEHD